ncbi:hypothetical protein F4859DRAFT_442960 [Xylaria cf. heliscus]|nr:hypothetical protein F4859DRAFT_442960 [Xylaria cf. heliscus]
MIRQRVDSSCISVSWQDTSIVCAEILLEVVRMVIFTSIRKAACALNISRSYAGYMLVKMLVSVFWGSKEFWTGCIRSGIISLCNIKIGPIVLMVSFSIIFTMTLGVTLPATICHLCSTATPLPIPIPAQHATSLSLANGVMIEGIGEFGISKLTAEVPSPMALPFHGIDTVPSLGITYRPPPMSKGSFLTLRRDSLRKQGQRAITFFFFAKAPFCSLSTTSRAQRCSEGGAGRDCLRGSSKIPCVLTTYMHTYTHTYIYILG